MNKPIYRCRRSIIAIFSICCLTALGYLKGADVVSSIATISLGVCAANAGENVFKGKKYGP